jgi:hypothetical protein
MHTCGYLRLRMSSDKTDRLIRHLNVEFNAIGIASREERWTVRYWDLSPYAKAKGSLPFTLQEFVGASEPDEKIRGYITERIVSLRELAKAL